MAEPLCLIDESGESTWVTFDGRDLWLHDIDIKGDPNGVVVISKENLPALAAFLFEAVSDPRHVWHTIGREKGWVLLPGGGNEGVPSDG